MSDLLDEAHEFLLCMDKTEYADALFALRAELAEANGGRRLADDALQQAQRALYRWLPSCDGGKYDDLIKNDAQYLFGLEHDASAREIGSEILAELTEARRQLAAQPAVPDDVARDAARYRFLRECVSNTDSTQSLVLDELMGQIDELDGKACSDALDAAIDAAILSATDSEVGK